MSVGVERRRKEEGKLKWDFVAIIIINIEGKGGAGGERKK